MKNEESLEASTLIGQLTYSVQHKVDNLLSDCVVASSVVVGGVFLAGDQLLGVEQLTVGSGTHFICLRVETERCLGCVML